MVKSGKGWDENLKRILFCVVGILYHLKGSLFKINLKTANDKKN
jgi:hypothetical protein